jgi:hypothetical protein
VRQNTIRRAKKKAERAVNQTWTHSLNESMRRVRCEHRDALGVFGAIFRGHPARTNASTALSEPWCIREEASTSTSAHIDRAWWAML